MAQMIGRLLRTKREDMDASQAGDTPHYATSSEPVSIVIEAGVTPASSCVTTESDRHSCCSMASPRLT